MAMRGSQRRRLSGADATGDGPRRRFGRGVIGARDGGQHARLHRSDIDGRGVDLALGGGEIGLEHLAQREVELLGALDQRAAAAAADEVRVGAQALVAGELVVEIRGEGGLQVVAAHRRSGGGRSVIVGMRGHVGVLGAWSALVSASHRATC